MLSIEKENEQMKELLLELAKADSNDINKLGWLIDTAKGFFTKEEVEGL